MPPMLVIGSGSGGEGGRHEGRVQRLVDVQTDHPELRVELLPWP
ncbi:hypothetical protein [Vitiosangium sp. GDMCC 1.1324]|nr:hypothetical protein [Vitiosangium sp. GDMCC 1.1324]